MPDLLDESLKLAEKLKKHSPVQLARLMGVSAKLAELNFQRYQDWHLPFTQENARHAVGAFDGDVYQGLQAESLSEEQLLFSQKRLRILSGLYGVLRPLDLIQAYRLEMGTPLSYYRKKDLYQFWGTNITQKINEALSESDSQVLVNLASNEYFKSIDKKKLEGTIVTPEFKDLKNGKYKMISFFAKKARGYMTRFILENAISGPEELLAFDVDGYHYNPHLSTENKPVFTREAQ